jgi:hypothetical protein
LKAPLSPKGEVTGLPQTPPREGLAKHKASLEKCLSIFGFSFIVSGFHAKAQRKCHCVLLGSFVSFVLQKSAIEFLNVHAVRPFDKLRMNFTDDAMKNFCLYHKKRPNQKAD